MEYYQQAADKEYRYKVIRRKISEELADEVPARVLALLALGAGLLVGARVGREEHPALDVGERRRHHEELAREVEVEHLHRLEVGGVLVGDAGDGDVVDVHLVLADEVEQEVERTLEDLEADLVVVGLELQHGGRR